MQVAWVVRDAEYFYMEAGHSKGKECTNPIGSRVTNATNSYATSMDKKLPKCGF